jgi:glutathione S-transferase
MSCDKKQCEDKKCCEDLKDSKATWTIQPEGKELKECTKCCEKLFKLFYFQGRGRAEISRLLMVIGGMKWLDVRIPQEEWAGKWKAKMPFGQLPCACVHGECQLAQSRAIEHYIATYTGLNGRDPLEQAKIDQLIEGLTDLLTPFNRANWEIKDEKEKKTALETYFKDTFPRIAGQLNKLIPENSVHAVGDRLTYADVAIYSSLFGFIAQNKDSLKDFAKLHAIYEEVSKHPKVVEWVAHRPQTPW